MKQIILLILIAFIATACMAAQNRAQQGGTQGAVAGAVIGQAIGRNTEGTLLGAAIGGILGYMIGNEMDKMDRQRLNNVYEYTPDNTTSEWVNPNTGNEYEATPVRTYREPQTHKNCREVELLATVDGKAEKTYTTACREDGRWILQ